MDISSVPEYIINETNINDKISPYRKYLRQLRLLHLSSLSTELHNFGSDDKNTENIMHGNINRPFD